jgi:hypothetical protein
MYTLSIEDTVEVPVKFTLKQGKVNKVFSFSVTGTRQPQEVIEGWIADNERKIKDILSDVVTDWSGQTLVMDGDKPAEFNAESFGAMLGVPGVAIRIYSAYLKECGAKEKN